MRIVYVTLLFCLCNSNLFAQQDLRDPRYIYHLDKEGVKYTIHEMPNYYSRPQNYDIAILYKGTLYKGVDFLSFYSNYDLINYEGKHYRRPRKIAKYTNDQSVKKLYVVGKARSPKKIQKIQSYFSKV